jgi:hypothetical protein
MAYNSFSTRRSTVITFKDMIKHLLDKVENIDEFYDIVGTGGDSVCMEKNVIHYWRKLCSADFMKDLYSVDDVLLKDDDIHYTWLWSKEKAEWMAQQLSELDEDEELADEEISRELEV